MHVQERPTSHIIDFNQCRADRHYRRALVYERDGELDAAVTAFEKAVRLAPDHLDAQLALAGHYHRLGMLDEAIARCQAVLEVCPDSTAYLYLGQALVNRGDYDDAVDALWNCLELDPTNASAHHEIAFIYYRRGQYEVAITEFHRAAQYEPSWETYFFLGECYRQTERFVEARTVLHKALTLADTWGQIELTRAQMQSIARRMEFPRDASLDLKASYYCENGIVYLGSGEDDGLNIPLYFFYDFDYHDIAITLQRLIAVTERFEMCFDAVVPADIMSLPLASALAQHWNVGTEPVADGHSLLVQALAEESATLQDALERTPDAVTFCLCAAWDEPWLPDFVGVCPPLGGSLPWYRDDVAIDAGVTQKQYNGLPRSVAIAELSAEPLDQILDRILDALATCEDDPALEEHSAYYALHHSRLRFQRSR